MRILLITHETSRTGAPRVAVSATKCLTDAGHRVEVIARARGPMLAEFEGAAPTSVELLGRVRRRLWRIKRLEWLAWLFDAAFATFDIGRRRPDLVYVNSSSAAIYLWAARRLRRRVLLHVHESGPLTRQFLDKARVSNLDGVTLVACSPSVQSSLVELANRSDGSVALVPSVPNDSEVLRRSAEAPDRPYGSELVVGCCGTVEHRKGADLWIAVAAKVRRELRDQPVRFVWVGDISEPVDLAGDSPDVEFVGPSPNPYAHMRRFDVATLPSRDDPFPLVVLESMLVGTPVVAFDVGSVAAQIGDTGLVVPPLDTDAFARGVVSLLADAVERKRLGTAARDRVMELYSTNAFSAALSATITTADRRYASVRANPSFSGADSARDHSAGS